MPDSTHPDPQTTEARTQDLIQDWADLGHDPMAAPPPDPATLLRSRVPPGSLVLGKGNGEVFFAVTPQGKILLGPNWTPDDAAQEFLTYLALRRQGMEARLAYMDQVENAMRHLALADARIRAQRNLSPEEVEMIPTNIEFFRAFQGIRHLATELLRREQGLPREENVSEASEPSVLLP